MNDRFKFRGVLKLDTQNIIIYSWYVEDKDGAPVDDWTKSLIKVG